MTEAANAADDNVSDADLEALFNSLDSEDDESQLSADSSADEEQSNDEPTDGEVEQEQEEVQVAPSIDLQAKLDALARENQQLIQRIKSDDGRVAAYQRKLDELKKQNQPDPAAANAALDQLADFAPEAVAAIKQRFDAVDAQVARFDEANEQTRLTREQMEAESRKNSWRQGIAAIHPDFQEIDDSPDFAKFISDRPDYVFCLQNGFADVKTSARYISEFKAEQNAKANVIEAAKQKLAADKNKKLNAALGATHGAATTPVDDDSNIEALFAKLAAEDDRLLNKQNTRR